jgi:hypothetical protein
MTEEQNQKAKESAGLARLLGDGNVSAQMPSRDPEYDEIYRVKWTKEMDDQLLIYFRDPSSTYEAIGEKMKLHPEAIRVRLQFMANRREEMKKLRSILR